MYGSGYGSVSGIVHLVARRPVVAAAVVLVAASVVYGPKEQPAPPTPPPPAVVVLSSVTKEPMPYVSSQENKTYTCEFGKATVPTNLCKATLDSIALYLNNNSDATVKVSGSFNHALAIRKYFTSGESKFDIAPSRIHMDIDSADDSSSVSIEQIP